MISILHLQRLQRLSSNIEKVPRGIRGETSSKDMASSRNLVSTIGTLARSQKGGTEPGVRKGKRSLLLACHTRCKCYMETINHKITLYEVIVAINNANGEVFIRKRAPSTARYHNPPIHRTRKHQLQPLNLPNMISSLVYVIHHC